MMGGDPDAGLYETKLNIAELISRITIHSFTRDEGVVRIGQDPLRMSCNLMIMSEDKDLIYHPMGNDSPAVNSWKTEASKT